MPFPLHMYLGKTLNAVNQTISAAHLEEVVKTAIRLVSEKHKSNQQYS